MPISLGYGVAAGLHGRWRAARQRAVPVPVISVGNLSVGGTGKTPCVIALAKLLCEMRPELARVNAIGILSRGYGRGSTGRMVVEVSSTYDAVGDEPLLIKRCVPQAAVIVDADRVASARYAHGIGCRILLLDDGFQYRQLARDLDIVMVDGAAPLGNGCLLPAGPLREAASSLKRATIMIGVGNRVDPAQQLAAKYGPRFSNAQVVMNLPESLQAPGTRVFAFCGIARPRRFEESLAAAGLAVTGVRYFADHHVFSAAELSEIQSEAGQSGASAVVTTAKDRLRVSNWKPMLNLETIEIVMNFTESGELMSLLDPIVARMVE